MEQSVHASIYDNDGFDDVGVTLRKVGNLSGNVVTLASLSSAGQSTSIQTPIDASITAPTVYYPDYAYFVTVCLNGPEEKLHSVRIYYGSRNVFLPYAVQKR